MGCSWSKELKEVFKSQSFLALEEEFQAMGLEKGDVQKLFAVFCRIAGNPVWGQEQRISLTSMLSFVMLEESAFTERVFSIFMMGVDFKQFVYAVWNFCTLTTLEELARFTFDMYDSDGSETLQLEEIDTMLEDVYGHKKDVLHHTPLVRNVITQLYKLQEDAAMKSAGLGSDEFVKFTRYHHGLLYPTSQMQAALRGRVLGAAFWMRQMRRRDGLVGYEPQTAEIQTQTQTENVDAVYAFKKRQGVEVETGNATPEVVKPANLLVGDMRGWGSAARVGRRFEQPRHGGAGRNAKMYVLCCMLCAECTVRT
ncbi:hypothetical protein B484DRAFT_7812 [Ochromonadaceae sp. CCMP2298]|nr:hypothetical protein B484DRAFT_7812 [Ochromonadaceae sp. CCMP2298]